MRDGQEFPLAPAMPASLRIPEVARPAPARAPDQQQFAARLGVPVGDHPELGTGQAHAARAGAGVLAVIAHAPEHRVCRAGKSLINAPTGRVPAMRYVEA